MLEKPTARIKFAYNIYNENKDLITKGINTKKKCKQTKSRWADRLAKEFSSPEDNFIFSGEKLSDFKECYPLQTAEFVVAQGIDNQPAFNWWVKKVLKKRNNIISLVKQRQTRYLKKTHKFGIQVPKTVNEAQELDRQNGDTKWTDSISKNDKPKKSKLEHNGSQQ